MNSFLWLDYLVAADLIFTDTRYVSRDGRHYVGWWLRHNRMVMWLDVTRARWRCE